MSSVPTANVAYSAPKTSNSSPTPPGKSESSERSSRSEPATLRRAVSNEISTDAGSFMSYIMAGVMTNQNFSVSSTATTESPEASVLSTPINFGGTFNMDPSMLILPEGIDAASLIAGADGQVNFSAELLAALTPGVPTDIEALGEIDGQAVVQIEGDPRLIATGLDPAQMQALVARLVAMSSEQAGAQPTPAVASSVAIVSFLPDQPLVDVPENAVVMASKAVTNSVIKGVNDAPPVIAQAVTDVATSLVKKTDIVSGSKETPQIVNVDQDVVIPDEEGFDPVEFRLAAKSSRYGAVNLYPAGGTTPPAPTVAAPVAQAVVFNAVIKGSMQANTAGSGANALASSLPADLDLGLSGSLASPVDSMLAPTALAPTPAQSTGLTNPVLHNVSAVQSHPTTQAVAALINKTAKNGMDGPQTLAIQLDPPELGKMHLKMRYEKGEPLRVHVVLEKADTMNMFQRDSHALQSALNQAGLETDSSSLTFDLGSQGTFDDALNGQDAASDEAGWAPDSEAAANDVIETRLSVVIDPKTGLAHYNLLV
jgi:flagellar hook-length control protein FliK